MYDEMSILLACMGLCLTRLVTSTRNVNRFVGTVEQQTVDGRLQSQSLNKTEFRELTSEFSKAFEHSLELGFELEYPS